ncbi:MAG: alpha/beta hydrolase [Saprospiraceae bacterium]
MQSKIYLFIALLCCLSIQMNAQDLMKYSDVLKLPVDSATVRLSYGPDTFQFGDLRLPEKKGPHKVVVIIHGGCWVSAIADLSLMDAMATQLTRDGYATWNLEYRRIGDPGGAWPNTFLDVAKGINYLKTIAAKYQLDLDHVVVTGHSAGGHLTLWQALQHQLPSDSEIFLKDPLPVSGVVSLAGIVDPSTYLLREGRTCGSNVDELLGGLPEEVPHRYQEAAPIKLLPAGVRTILITGKQDNTVPIKHVKPYYLKAKASGEWVKNIEVDNAAHFEVISPGSTAWKAISKSIRKLSKREAGKD